METFVRLQSESKEHGMEMVMVSLETEIDPRGPDIKGFKQLEEAAEKYCTFHDREFVALWFADEY